MRDDQTFQLEYIKSLAENLKFCLDEAGRINRTILRNGLDGIIEAVERLESADPKASPHSTGKAFR
ncbi:hypothetical protein [Agrobacterium tumefaciens]|uniref:hypothetical protein n=1 Tax=Agrobacterium tumefaciens TaxID=358 RepID=UPI001ADA2D0A|nr:hypothetical protein [Agrobacterium tumefaciens]